MYRGFHCNVEESNAKTNFGISLNVNRSTVLKVQSDKIRKFYLVLLGKSKHKLDVCIDGPNITKILLEGLQKALQRFSQTAWHYKLLLHIARCTARLPFGAC